MKIVVTRALEGIHSPAAWSGEVLKQALLKEFGDTFVVDVFTSKQYRENTLKSLFLIGREIVRLANENFTIDVSYNLGWNIAVLRKQDILGDGTMDPKTKGYLYVVGSVESIIARIRNILSNEDAEKQSGALPLLNEQATAVEGFYESDDQLANMITSDSAAKDSETQLPAYLGVRFDVLERMATELLKTTKNLRAFFEAANTPSLTKELSSVVSQCEALTDAAVKSRDDIGRQISPVTNSIVASDFVVGKKYNITVKGQTSANPFVFKNVLILKNQGDGVVFQDAWGRQIIMPVEEIITSAPAGIK